MDLDFLLTTIIYLICILLIHFYLKKFDVNVLEKPQEISDDSDEIADLKNKLQEYEQSLNDENTDKSEDTNKLDDELIIKTDEIDTIKNDVTNNDFLKYLNVEDYEKTSSYQNLVQPVADNNINVTENSAPSDLDQYFVNLKDEQYKFEDVPTVSNQQDYSKKGLLNDINKLTEDRVYDNVYAFDEFNTSYAPL